MMEIIKMIGLLVWIVVGLLSIAIIGVSYSYTKRILDQDKELGRDYKEEA
jgi:hypothetical protein